MDYLKTGTILHGKSYDYKIVSTLGQGTFGITYLASVTMSGGLGSLDSELLVAIKEFFMRDFNGRNESSVTYSSKDGAFAYYKSKFVNEAKNLSNLHNPGIIKVIELFEENQTAYYVMEYVSNGSLDDLIKVKGRLSSEECVSYTLQIAETLGYMHENKMLHLDLKPNNIMVRKDQKLILIDFGLSKRFDAFGKPETSTTIGHGTPGYAPVEQANYQGGNTGEFPSTMDIYALGGTMFKMLTGHRPPEASIILNDGFPYSELQDIGVAKTLADIVAQCMEPRCKNRYKDTSEVIHELNKIKNHSEESKKQTKGYFKRKKGEIEHGTFEIENVPVTSSIDFPEYINIKLWDNSRNGISYEIILTDGHFEDGCYNLVKIWDKGILIDEHKFMYGIPKDVKAYLVAHGFLSTEHWEDECETSPIGDNFGTEASITMVQTNGERFERRVTHAHPAYHNLLLYELNELLKSTSLFKELQLDESKRIHTERFIAPNDVFEFQAIYKPAQIEGGKGFGGYSFSINENSLYVGNTKLSNDKFRSLIKDINTLGIEFGPQKKVEHDYSESPAELSLYFTSKSEGVVNLSLMAFNTNMLAGNIYDADIIKLAESIHHIILRYLPQKHEPTQELIYSIPDSASEISIDYSEGGVVGGNNATARIRIGKNKISSESSEFEYTYDPDEFNQVADGLRDLKLHAQVRSYEEPSTGIMFPTLTITLYDNDGNQIKKFYAQDNGVEKIGDIALPVESLKKELVKICPTFNKALNKSKETKTGEDKKHSWSEVIIFSILASVAVGIIALPAYLFLKPTDTLFNWLWLSIGITELAVLSFSIFGIKDETKFRENISFISFILGIIAFVAYIVMWIIQMFKWWL